ncbi:aspartyl protease family protein [Cognatiluteimonas weifangensis]
MPSWTKTACCLLALAAVLPAASAPALAQGPADAAPIAVLKLEPYRKSVAVRVVANGKPGLFTLDTAGGNTVVSPAFAAAAGCKPWGRMVGFQMTGNRLEMPRCDDFDLSVGGHALRAPVAGVLDVTALIAKDAEPVDGSLALDVFDGQTISIDFAAGELVVESPASARRRIAGARELPLRLVREYGVALAAMVEVPTRKGIVRFEIDSGNGGTILVSRPYAALFGLDPEAQGPQHGAFDIAPGIRVEGLMFTPDLTIDGNIGMPFLKDWVVTLDLAEGRLWVQRSRATPPPGMGTPPPLPRAA